MPKIKIWEKDTTGLDTSINETIIFVPGSVKLDDSDTDENGCFIIKPAAGDNILANVPEKIINNEYVTSIIESGLQVLYKGFDSSISTDSSLDLNFLSDKNAYNIRFLTAGGCQIADIDDSSYSNYKLKLLNSLTKIAAKRGDCAVIGALSTDIDSSTAINTIKTNLSDIEIKDDNSDDISSFASIFVAKMIDNDSSNDDSIALPYTINSYPDLAYLQSYSEAIKNNNIWESLANSARGSVPKFNKNSVVSKYDLDNAMDTKGRSFNGIINLRPTNQPVIWGDRTLLKNDEVEGILNLKATSFLSIRNIISDIAKRAYESAIRNTFETNNDITWTNFKSSITQLLDAMVADYKIANYKIIKKPTMNRAEIKCEIHVSPYGPVEDFDIGIILTNTSAETTVE